VNRIYVSTAQVRALVAVDLSLINAVLQLVNSLLSAVVATINTLLAPGCLLGGSCTQTDLQILPAGLNLDVGLEAGVGSSYVTDYACNLPTRKSLTATTEVTALKLKVGRIDPTSWFSSASSPVPTPITLYDVGSLACQGHLLAPMTCGARTRFAGGGAEIMIDSSVVGSKESNYVYDNPKDVNVAPMPLHSVSVSNVVGSLSGTLGGVKLKSYPVTLSSGLLGLVLGTLLSTLTQVFDLLTVAINGLLSPLVDPLLNSLLFNLGIDVNKVDVGFNLTCGQKGKAYLVI
jgi:hypothetical protein